MPQVCTAAELNFWKAGCACLARSSVRISVLMCVRLQVCACCCLCVICCFSSIVSACAAGQLLVNFDKSMMQLIRETKHLQRMGVAVPESARQVLAQEEKFKIYFNQLTYVLKVFASLVRAKLASQCMSCRYCKSGVRPLSCMLLFWTKLVCSLSELL